MDSKQDEANIAAHPQLDAVTSSNSGATSMGSFTSWFRRHGDKSRLGSQDITMRERDAEDNEAGHFPHEYRTYKRRWFGLVQLTLMNIVVSWNVSPLGAQSTLESTS